MIIIILCLTKMYFYAMIINRLQKKTILHKNLLVYPSTEVLLMNNSFAIGVVRFFQDNGLKAIWGLGLPDQIKVALDEFRSKIKVRPGFALVRINLETGEALPTIRPDQISEALDDLRKQRRRFLGQEAIDDIQASLDFYHQKYGAFGKPVITVLRFVRKTRKIAGLEVDQPVSRLGFGLGDTGYGSAVYGKKGVVDGYQAVYIFFVNERQSQAVCLPLVDRVPLEKIIDDLAWQEKEILALEKSQENEKRNVANKRIKATLHRMGT